MLTRLAFLFTTNVKLSIRRRERARCRLSFYYRKAKALQTYCESTRQDWINHIFAVGLCPLKNKYAADSDG